MRKKKGFLNNKNFYTDFLALFIGLLVMFLAFVTSYLGDNIIVVIN